MINLIPIGVRPLTKTPPQEEHDGPDSYDHLTIMEGPDLSGKSRVWFGVWPDPIEQLDEEEGTRVVAAPADHVELPHPMTRPEIEEWLEDDGRGEDLLDRAADDPNYRCPTCEEPIQTYTDFIEHHAWDHDEVPNTALIEEARIDE